MDNRELDKKMRADVKPGTESLAINEAQTAANQLLTEQRMNNESARAIMTSNSERDTELRGAIELGAMAQPQQAQVIQQLPVQAAGLRPETQQLLAKYGVNPQISERSRSNSNNTQTRSTNTVRKDVPSPQGGRTTVTNTTNITNITNNNSKVETDIDMADSKPAPVPVQRVVAQPVAATPSGDGRFKAFLNNLFAKRDLERRTQEKEFRKRDWELQRMTRKVMERMEKISTTFARNMNPENVGRTYGSQIKMMLTMAGLTLLPKLFPKLISGINTVGDVVMKGVDFIKTTFNSADGNVFEKLGTTIMESTKELGTTINKSIGRWIAGPDSDAVDSDGNGYLGIGEAISNKLAHWLGGNADPNGENTLSAVLSNLAEDFKNGVKQLFDTFVEDRSVALKTAWDSVEFDLTDMQKNFSSLSKLIGAAIGGHRFLETSAMNDVKSAGRKEALEGVSDKDKDYFNNIVTSTGASQVMSNLGNAARDEDNSNTATILEGNKKLLDYYNKNKDASLIIKKKDFDAIVARMADPNSKKAIEDEIKDAISKGLVNEIKTYKEGTKNAYSHQSMDATLNYGVSPEYVPVMLSMMSGVYQKFDELGAATAKKELNSMYSWRNYNNFLKSRDIIASGNTKGGMDWGNLMSNAGKFLGYIDGLHFIDAFNADNYNDVYKTGSEVSSLGQFGVYKAAEAANQFSDRYDNAIDTMKGEQYQRTAAHLEQTAKELPGKMKEGVINLSSQAWDATKDARRFLVDTYDYTTRGADMTGHGQHDSNYTRGLYASGSQGNQSKSPVTKPTTEVPKPAQYTEIDKETWIANRIKELENSSTPIARTPENLRSIAEDEYKDEVLSKRNRTPLEQRIQYVMNFLQSSGFTAEQAAGMTGVLIAESNLDPTAVNKMEEKKFGFHKAGKGIAQWSNSRNDDFINWYKANYGKDKVYPNQASLEAQLKFMLFEMAGRTAFMDAMKQVNHPDQAADIMLRGYENGGPNKLASKADIDKTYAKYNNGYDKQYLTRVGHARDVYALYTGNMLSGPIDQALLEGSNYTGDNAKITDFGDTASNTFSGLINTFNDMFGKDENWMAKDTGAKIENVDGGSLNKYTQSESSTENSAEYTANIVPETTVTTAKIDQVTEASNPVTQAAKSIQTTAEKPQVTNDMADNKPEVQQPNMINTGGNVMNSGNVSTENTTINYYGRSTSDDVGGSYTQLRSRDLRNG